MLIQWLSVIAHPPRLSAPRILFPRLTAEYAVIECLASGLTQATKVLIALLVVGVCFWVLHLMIRAKRVEVERHAMDLDSDLISDGFHSS